MPIAHIHIIEGRDADNKRKLIENVSRAIAESLDAPIESVRVMVQEYPASMFGIGGQSAEQRRAAASQAPTMKT